VPFIFAHITRFFRRIALNYFVRDFSFASLCILAGLPLLFFGLAYGLANWVGHMVEGTVTPTGSIMLAVMSILLGIQLVLFFFSADIASAPRQSLHILLAEQTIRPLHQFHDPEGNSRVQRASESGRSLRSPALKDKED
jgi:hypothetical protein